ncbi:MAG: bifunctional folylpolyglutamate synthase/dihydrofolate synthase, partial [Candidatus Bipolaricaulota bacterium]
ANLGVAVSVLGALRDEGWSITADSIRRGLAAVRWPGRGEVVREHPWILLDAAHNPAGAAALVATLDALASSRHRRLLVGVFADKDVDAIADAFAPAFGEIIATESSSERAMPADDVAAALGRLGASVTVSHTVAEGLEVALRGLREEDVLVISGSLTVVGEARAALIGGPCDSP